MGTRKTKMIGVYPMPDEIESFTKAAERAGVDRSGWFLGLARAALANQSGKRTVQRQAQAISSLSRDQWDFLVSILLDGWDQGMWAKRQSGDPAERQKSLRKGRLALAGLAEFLALRFGKAPDELVNWEQGRKRTVDPLPSQKLEALRESAMKRLEAAVEELRAAKRTLKGGKR